MAHTQDIQIPAGSNTLAGTLTTPEVDGPWPIAVLIAGSGPLDRDGNHKRLPLSVSKDLAEELAAVGWASVRYDKRGIGGSTGDYLSTGFFDELDDARAAVAWARNHDDATVVVPVGHSVGALYAAEMSASDDVDGAVLLAYTAKTGRDTLVWQANAISETVPGFVKGVLKLFGSSVTKQQAKAIAKLEKTTGDVERSQGQKINAKWMREFIDYDPEPALRMTKTPLLAITGSKDVQVDPADLDVMESVVGDRCTTLRVDDVDHILRFTEAPVSNPSKYKHQIEKPIDDRVVDALTSWLADLAVEAAS